MEYRTAIVCEPSERPVNSRVPAIDLAGICHHNQAFRLNLRLDSNNRLPAISVTPELGSGTPDVGMS